MARFEKRRHSGPGDFYHVYCGHDLVGSARILPDLREGKFCMSYEDITYPEDSFMHCGYSSKGKAKKNLKDNVRFNICPDNSARSNRLHRRCMCPRKRGRS